MTISELLKKGTALLNEKSIDNADAEALWMLEGVLECSLSYILLNGNNPVSDDICHRYTDAVSKRISGLPVQYVLGKWDFYGSEFTVGEGVLIPRPETELLVDYALDYLKNIENPVVIDLCAGTGCIGLTVARLVPTATVYLVEKYNEAFSYLTKNSEGLTNVKLIKGDVLTCLKSLNLPAADLVLSNPPYIESAEIESLQSEVLREPVTALDGGEDGLIFYRAIANALPAICKGAVAVECGENQAAQINNIFGDCKVINDFADIARVVVCERINK